MERHRLDKCQVEIDGGLWWNVEGTRTRIESLVRCFPNSSPEGWISVRAEDGSEMTLIRKWTDLDEESRAKLEPVLLEKYHVPVITELLSIERSAAGKRVRVMTRDGIDSLNINSETDVDYREYPRVTVSDRTKRRKYVIEDAGDLDKPSRDLIRRHLRTPGRRGRGGRFH